LALFEWTFCSSSAGSHGEQLTSSTSAQYQVYTLVRRLSLGTPFPVKFLYNDKVCVNQQQIHDKGIPEDISSYLLELHIGVHKKSVLTTFNHQEKKGKYPTPNKALSA
jgi:hypothetical protein